MQGKEACGSSGTTSESFCLLFGLVQLLAVIVILRLVALGAM